MENGLFRRLSVRLRHAVTNDKAVGPCGHRHGFACGHVSREDLVGLYAGCRAAFYAPDDEDYGYVTLEAMLARRPVVTCSDAGGPLDFVRDGDTGRVAEPTPEARPDELA